MADSISLEETNKLRISMGLAPIADPNAQGADAVEMEPDEDEVAEQRFRDRMESERKARQDKEVAERIAKAQNTLALNAKLKGKSLAAEDQDDDDTAAWLKKQKKRAKQLKKEMELAKRREEEEAEREREAYGEDDLKGLKVAHDADAFEEGKDVILTLKDGRILDGDEDELQNVNIADDEAVKASKERKRKAKAAYTGYDDDEFGESAAGRTREVLSKYDDDVMIGRSEGFRLGGNEDSKGKKRARDEEGGLGDMADEVIGLGGAVNRQLLNLDYTKNFDVSDYATEDTTFKKKKKKAKRSTRKADVGEGEIDGDGDVAMEGTERKVMDRTVDENLVDDDELQMALSRQRRQITRKAPRMKAEDIAARMAAERANGSQEAEEAGPSAVDQITFDDTSEFVRNVSMDNLIVKREAPMPTASTSASAEAGPSSAPIEEDVKPVIVKIETVDDPVEDEEGAIPDGMDVDEEEDDELAEMALRQGLSLAEMRLKLDSELAEKIKAEEEDAMISKPEPSMSGGMAGVLALLRQQGAVKAQTEEEKARERTQKERDLWLADHRRRLAQRELEKIKARGGNKDQAQREWENKMRDQQDAREALAAYANYKPDINIVYTDEYGRTMTPKEAWKSLSHRFHGKTSGRMKTELRLKRIEEERKRAAATMGDTATGMLDAFARRQQATGEAYMTLSMGNKAYVPMGDAAKTKAKAQAAASSSKPKKEKGPKVLG